jgi:threonine dehydrogenase-like Zn-dependent dehydrogenase
MKALRFHYNLPRVAATRIIGQIWPRAYVSRLAPARLESVPNPQLPRDDWVRVRTRLAGICGSDVKQITLKGARDNPLTALISLPHVLGHEAVGVIESVGLDVQERKVGERIVLNPWLSCVPRGIDPVCPACRDGDLSTCRNFERGILPAALHLGNNTLVPGAFAPLFVCHESQCFPVPEEVSDDAAVLADPFSVSLHAVLRNPPPTDTPALVYGLGALGLMAVAILRNLFPEVEVYAVGRHPHQSELARTLGARKVLVGRPEELILQVAELTGAKPLRPWHGSPWLLDGVGVVYDMVGSAQSVETAIRLVQTHRRVVVAGVEIPRRFEWTPLYFKEVTVVGSNAFGVELFCGERRHAIDIYLELSSQGLDLTRLITHRFSLQAWPEAFTACMQRRASAAVKVVFDFDL